MTSPHTPPTDKPSVHGMVLLGRERIFLSHLPMFHTPHNYQVILEVSLSKPGIDPQASYVEDQQQTGTLLYTIAPEKFVLPELAWPDLQTPKRRSFHAAIYRGHFEREGVPILEDVLFTVTRVIHFRKFDPNASALPALEYFFFGSPQELFLAHSITRAPDFDHLLPVQVASHPFREEALQQGIPVVFPDRPNVIAERLGEHQQVVGHLQHSANGTAQLSITIGDEIYLETGDLAS
jgi:hypothetical protein